MADVGQGEIGDSYGIERLLAPYDDNEDNEPIGGGGQTHIGSGGPPCDDKECKDDCRSKSDYGNNDQVLDNYKVDHIDPEDPGRSWTCGIWRTHGTSGPCLHDSACQIPNLSR